MWICDDYCRFDSFGRALRDPNSYAQGTAKKRADRLLLLCVPSK